MRTEKEIIKKREECFFITRDKLQDPATVAEANFYSGAWYALLWVLKDTEEI